MKQLYSFKSSNNVQNSGEFENKMVGKMISESKEKLLSKENDVKKGLLNTLVESQS